MTMRGQTTGLVITQVRRRRKPYEERPVITQVKRRRSSTRGTAGINATLAIPDELLELVLLRVESPVDLICAASVCKRWCHVVADAGFLRRFQSAHDELPVAGKYLNNGTPPDKPHPLPVFVPSPTTTMDAHRFSLDFLPDRRCKRLRVRDVVDSRGSLLLLDRNGKQLEQEYRNYLHRRSHNNFQDVIVCEPLTRRYVRLSPKTAFTERQHIAGIYLGDGDTGRGISIEDFKVLCLLKRCDDDDECKFHVGVLCSAGSWRKIGIDCQFMISLGAPTEAYLYFYTGGRELIAVDRRSADVSTLVLPDIEDWETRRHDLRATGGYSDGRDRIVFRAEDALMVFAWKDAGGGGELVLDKVVEFTEVTRGLRWRGEECREFCWHTTIGTVAGRTLGIVVGPPLGSVAAALELGPLWMFNLDVETLEVLDLGDDWTCEMEYPYQIPWPPVLPAGTDMSSSSSCNLSDSWKQ